ncbi:hypothetical protein [Anaerovibrio sp.]|uniref:hypothetical protein n=1 Tax=Anaerovibrio sp. TaxID=1872532 RepID=UPI0025BA28A7|nr:hypothetical protein [Anaerovibrio sp.]
MSDTIVLLRDNGNALRLPYSEFLEEGIFELRAKVGKEFLGYYNAIVQIFLLSEEKSSN